MSYQRIDETQRRRATIQLNAEVIDRLVRLETRLVQLMYFLGADPADKYDRRAEHKGDKHAK